MPPSKENDVLTITPDVSSSSSTPNSARPESTAARPQPVALEVPVTVNGARTVEGSDKREPFAETTKTVLVFGNGAVIRLGSAVSPGQLLFLTNDKTKKEVVCQVVKSKNYSSMSGYVELEFTEPVSGFWGMRFPSDRAITAAPVRSSSTPAAGIPAGAVSPGAKVANAPVAATPKAPEINSPSSQLPGNSPAQLLAGAPKIETPAITQAKHLPEAPATKKPEPPPAPVAGLSSSLATSLASLLDEAEAQTPTAPSTAATPSIPASGKPASSGGSKESEELKVHTARLQEELSSLLFNPEGKKPVSNAPTTAALNVGATPNAFTGVSEIAKPAGAPTSAALPAKPATPPAKFSLDAEEVKIPAWLEPLARNAAAPASTQELIEREKAKHASAAETASREQTSEEPLPITAVEPVASPASDLPTIGNLLPLDEELLTERRPKGSRKGLAFGAIAAAVLAAAGGAWYFLQPADNAQRTTAQFPFQAPSQPQAAAPSRPAVQPPVQPNVQSNAESGSSDTAQNAKPSSVSTPQPSTKANAPERTPSVAPTPTQTKGQPAAVAAKENGRGSGSTIPAAEKELISRPTAQPEPKKPAIGEVHLASPTMSRRVTRQTDGEAAPTLTLGADAGNPGLESAFSNADKQPAAPEAPLAAGGNVTPAKLISKVDAIYPSIAKSQHVSGDVVIDALIDATGRVTTMKVLSGPALLHQAAKDCLRQWKYQPATLDGNPVPMHLTLKLQFRMQ